LTQQLSDLTDFGFHAGGDDDTRSATAGDGAARKGEVDAVTNGHVGIGEDGFRLFADGGGLSSQMRLISGQIDTLSKAKISGYDITGSERDDVAFDQ
jgi:hypothetical protein